MNAESDPTLDLFDVEGRSVPEDDRADSRTPESEPPPARPTGPKVWSVTQVNRAIRLMLEEQIPPVWVAGEVAVFAEPAGPAALEEEQELFGVAGADEEHVWGVVRADRLAVRLEGMPALLRLPSDPARQKGVPCAGDPMR